MLYGNRSVETRSYYHSASKYKPTFMNMPELLSYSYTVIYGDLDYWLYEMVALESYEHCPFVSGLSHCPQN